MSDGSQECNQEEADGSGIAEEYAHRLADDRKWDDVKVLTAGEIAQICATDSGMAQNISEVIQGSTKAAQKKRHGET